MTLLKKFNTDNVIYTDKMVRKLKHLMQHIGGLNQKHMMGLLTMVLLLLLLLLFKVLELIVYQNESINFELLDEDVGEIKKERKKRIDKEQKEQAKIDSELRKRLAKQKKRFHKQKKGDRETEKIGLVLCHSADERHVLAYRSTG